MDGLLIAEIQQNSNTTYRVFDWNRVGADGKPRALHIDKALDVIDFSMVEPRVCPPEPLASADGCSRFLLCRNRYFVTERVELEPGATYRGRCDGSTLEIWGVIEGEANVSGEQLEAVRFALLPAAMGDFAVTTQRGATLLRSYVE
jgi:mannose-6-phosphate isomerase